LPVLGPARKHIPVSRVAGAGREAYQLRRWSNTYSGAGAPGCHPSGTGLAAPTAARAEATSGAAVGPPKWARIVVAASMWITKAMMRI
jgi:hypothetical protein